MQIIGLTGSIAAGKSTVAAWLREIGIPLHDADAAVHQLLAAGGAAVGPVLDLFGPVAGSLHAGIDRKRLGDLVFNAPDQRQQLEQILHPLVRLSRDAFIDQHRAASAALVVLDVPLLFETGGDAICDQVIVVYAKPATIEKRALDRAGMTRQKLAAILASQMPVDEKMARADFCLDSDLALETTKQNLLIYLSGLMPPKKIS